MGAILPSINMRTAEGPMAELEAFAGWTAKSTNNEIAVLGAAFKPESDDVRDSPALDIAARLHSIGADVHVYDPKANENAAKRYPRVDYASSLIQAVARAEVVVLLTEWDEFRRMTPQDLAPLVRRRQILDGVAPGELVVGTGAILFCGLSLLGDILKRDESGQVKTGDSAKMHMDIASNITHLGPRAIVIRGEGSGSTATGASSRTSTRWAVACSIRPVHSCP